MEVTLKIEANQLGETVVDLFKSLNEDQRKAIATDILTKWLQEPFQIEREAYSEGILREFRQSNVKIGWNKNANELSDKEIKESSEYRNKVREFKSSREIMIKEITNEVIVHFKNSIQEQIKIDPKFEELRGEVYQFIVDNFPKMIKESIVNFFANHLSSIAITASSAMNDRMWFENSLQNMKQQLKNKYNVEIE